MKKIYFIVYQASIANVFKVKQSNGERKRIVQNAFGVCEHFCRGLREAGEIVKPAWCNKAGDIKNECWSIDNFDLAPFNDSFASDFVAKEV